jgi:elongation factor Ts
MSATTRRILELRRHPESWPVPPVRDDEARATVAHARVARRTSEGLITSYVHPRGKIGVLVEVNCETEVNARSRSFAALARQLAEHIAAAAPLATHRRALPPALVERKHRAFTAEVRAQGKPERHVEMIVEGRMEAFFRAVVLMDQTWIHDPDTTIAELVAQESSRLGERVLIRRFSRFHIGIA